MKRWQTENEDVALKTKARSGQPTKISPQDGNRVLEYIARKPFITAPEVVEELQLHCHPQTVRAYLHKHGIHSRRPAKKVEFFPRHTVSRLDFARANIDRNWDSVIFTDEKVFSTSQDTRKLVWRSNNTRLDPRNVVTIRKSSRISLAYWGWMSSAGPGELTRIDTRMNAVEYIRVLEDILLPSVRAVYPAPHRIVLVQDNSAVHTAGVVREWFEDHQGEIELLPWPAKSPDLNPIENLWAAMGRMWEQRDVPIPRNRQNLHQHVGNIWENFRGQETCGNLVASMPARLQEVIENNGYWTQY